MVGVKRRKLKEEGAADGPRGSFDWEGRGEEDDRKKSRKSLL